MQLYHALGRVLDYCPLQQGLRLNKINIETLNLLVLDYCPLQQGLRHHVFHTVLEFVKLY